MVKSIVDLYEQISFYAMQLDYRIKQSVLSIYSYI